jgi:hypothetical protein
LLEKRQSGRVIGNYDSITGLEKSFEGRSPRALGVERDFQGFLRAKTVERVAKPYGRDFQGAWQRMLDAS